LADSDEDFFCYGEDVDLGFRLQLAGYGCLYVPTAIARHYGSAVTVEHSDFSTYYGQRNLVWVYVKNMPPILLWLLMPYHLILNLAAVVGCAPARPGGHRLEGKSRCATAALVTTWRKRSSIQRMRQASAAGIWRLLEHGWHAHAVNVSKGTSVTLARCQRKWRRLR
jgi:hypothetical protein